MHGYTVNHTLPAVGPLIETNCAAQQDGELFWIRELGRRPQPPAPREAARGSR